MKPVALIVLDGYGLAPPGPGNAVHLANPPHINSLFQLFVLISVPFPFFSQLSNVHLLKIVLRVLLPKMLVFFLYPLVRL